MAASLSAYADNNPFVGKWALMPAPGGAGCLEIEAKDGYFDGRLLWIGGSPEKLGSIYFDGGTLHALRVRMDDVKDTAGKVIRQQVHPINVTATVNGDAMTGEFSEPSSDGTALFKTAFTGRRTPPPPPAPDLKKVKFGKPIKLFNGKNLDGWVVTGGAHWAELKDEKAPKGKGDGWVAVDKDAANGWSVKNGLLINDPVQPEGKPRLHYGNIVTKRSFDDFNLTLDVNVGPKGNSGVYLRGVCEVQVEDSYGEPVDCHNMGGIYGRITPLVAAEKPAGEWQHMDITLVNRHVTVKLNGKLIVDNQPLDACTGGALWSDLSLPGPIYLQGDHTGVKYRNIVLRPVKP